MATITRQSRERIDVVDAKNLLRDAAPLEDAVAVFRSSLDGTLKLVPRKTNYHAKFLDDDFLEMCRQLHITPRLRYRPVQSGYNGDPETDDQYTISFEEFRLLAELHGHSVEIAASVDSSSAAAHASGPHPVAARSGEGTSGKEKASGAIAGDIAEVISGLQSARARIAANARHGKPGGSRDKKKAIQAIWASGKYSSRDICAEQECAALGMSMSTARKALLNTPDPS